MLELSGINGLKRIAKHKYKKITIVYTDNKQDNLMKHTRGNAVYD